ncbi:MAG: LolA family protein [Syntrophomonadaceae bacterium]|jgi:outer membrane lipoprotein-sorting protein
MDNNEKIISDVIDDLNEERKPRINRDHLDNTEIEEVLKTARLIRTLKEPALPDSGYPRRLANNIANKIKNNDFINQQREERNDSGIKINELQSRRLGRKRILTPAVALVASFLIFALFIGRSNLFNNDIAYAMEKAVGELSSYHGSLKVSTQNEAGQEWMIRQIDIWSEGNKYALLQNDGTLTVNNGQQKWQVLPHKKEVVLLPLIPDPTQNTFDLRDEVKRAKEYPHKVVGSEIISGRQTAKLEISPPGGLSYHMWIDKETNLPVQLQTAMQKALQTTYTFVSFEPNVEFDPKTFTFQIPEGYKIIENDPGQIVTTIEEAARISGFTPLLPQQAPDRIFAYKERIILDYADTIITETIAQGPFTPKANSALGKAAGGPLEVWWESLRWRQDNVEIMIEGPQREKLAREIAPDLALPDSNQNLANQAQVRLPVDMDIVKGSQQQVDSGSSPWQLDPLQVALTFVNLKVTPEGIVGEPNIAASSFKLLTDNGVEAVVEVADGPVKKVYLKRLVRQDESGIWSVIGYDPR